MAFGGGLLKWVGWNGAGEFIGPKRVGCGGCIEDDGLFFESISFLEYLVSFCFVSVCGFEFDVTGLSAQVFAGRGGGDGRWARAGFNLFCSARYRVRCRLPWVG